MMTRPENRSDRRSADALTRFGPPLAIVAMLLAIAFALFVLPLL